MPDLDFGESDEEAILVLKGFAHRVNTDLYNHGTKGLLTTFSTFVATHEARETERERQINAHHRENSTKINILMAIGAIGMLVLTAIGIFVTIEVSRHSQFDPAKIFHSQSFDPVLSFRHIPQDAQIPPLTR